MSGFGTILVAVLPVFLLLMIGFAIRHWDWVTAESEKSIMRLVVNLLYPSLIFHFILGNESLREGWILLEAGLIGFLFVAAGCALAYVGARAFRIRDARERRTFACTVGTYNFGYLAIPLATLLFSQETIGVMLVVNVGVEFGIWTIGVLTLTGKLDRNSLRRALSPPVLAMLVAVPLNLTGLGSHLPGFFLDLVTMLGNCAIPIGLLLIGVTFRSLLKSSDVFRDPRYTLGACALRLGIMPPLMLTTAWLLPLNPLLAQVILIHAAMPCAVFSVVLSKYYGGSGRVALATVLSSNIVALITIPLWIPIGMRWLNLDAG